MPTQHHDTYPAISTANADLSGRVVVISGASKGIGRATALSYARAGASGIVITARSDLSSLKDEMIKAAKDAGRSEPKIMTLGVDVVDARAVENAAEEIKATFGKIDILVYNAGFLGRLTRLEDSDPDEWWRNWEVNVKGLYLVTKCCLPLVLKSELKTLVGVSSIGAHLTVPGMSGYQSSKTAGLRILNFLTVEYGEQGLLALGVHPGVSVKFCGDGTGLPAVEARFRADIFSSQSVLTELASILPKDLHSRLTDTPELAADALVWLTKERREW